MARETARKLGIEADLEKVTDPKSIAMAGVMTPPGLMVDGKLVHTGSPPDSAKLETSLSA